jgi:hypothetical protein
MANTQLRGHVALPSRSNIIDDSHSYVIVNSEWQTSACQTAHLCSFCVLISYSLCTLLYDFLNSFVCCSKCFSHPHALLIDNYSRTFRFRKPQYGLQYKDALWAGESMHMYRSSPGPSVVSLSLLPISPPPRNRQQLLQHQLVVSSSSSSTFISALPKDLWQEMPTLDEIMKQVDDLGDNLYDTSFVVTHHINSVPLKPYVNPDEDPTLHQVLAEKRDGMADLVPTRLLHLNPASDAGLLQYMVLLQQQMEEGGTYYKRYLPLVSDVNIFGRIVKVRSNLLSNTLSMSTTFVDICIS